jgi:HK97 family phage major capsid protein
MKTDHAHGVIDPADPRYVIYGGRRMLRVRGGDGSEGDTATIEDVAKSVHDLTEAVEQMREGSVDQETVERIATEVLERQAAAQEAEGRERGYTPPETEVQEGDQRPLLRGDHLERSERIHTRSARQVAPLIRREPADVEYFHQRSDELLLVSTALGVDPRETQYFNDEYLPALRAVDSQTAGEGQEYVPKLLSASLIERINLGLRVVALFPQIEMPSQPFEIPGLGLSRQRLGSHAEQTADTGQTKFKAVTPATRKITLDAKKFAGRMLVSREEEEDAIVAVLEWMQAELTTTSQADLEDTAINGDTTGTHQDSDVTAADDPRKNWVGLRKVTTAGAKTDAANAPDGGGAARNRSKMGKYGVDPSSSSTSSG